MADLFGHEAPPQQRPPHGKRARDRLAALTAERERLEIEIAQLEEASIEANIAETPFRSAFRQADQALRELWDDREYGVLISTPDMLAAYDRRVAAGHAWWPTQQPAEWLRRALKQKYHELRAVNLAIGK